MKIARNGNGDLPQELVQDILVRLTVKVLSRCKCVSKNWCSLIESRNFVKCHFESRQERLLIKLPKLQEQYATDVDEPVPEHVEPHHEQIPDQEEDEDQYATDVDEPVPEHVEPHHEQIPDQEEDEDVEALYYERENDYHREAEQEGCMYALYTDETFSDYKVPIHLQIPEEAAVVLGPLNGVFCVAAMHDWGSHMALLNPALRQFKPLPPMALVKPPMTLHDRGLGFGLDPFTGDYKIVSLLNLIDVSRDNHLSRQCVVSVCTSDSDSWRVLEDVDSILLTRSAIRSLCNTYLNGAYYWLLDDYHTTDVAILAFDMGIDKFRQIQVTGCDPKSKYGYLALCGDSLALLMHDTLEHPGRFLDVWIMKDEGCWIKSSKVGPLEGISWPVCFWKNNELSLDTKIMTLLLFLCNVTTEDLKTFEAKRKCLDYYSHWVFAYKESLVSIKGEAGNCMVWDTSSYRVKEFFKELSSEEVPIVV